jgi:MFS family permease
VVFLPYYFFTVMHFTVLSSALLSSVVAVSGGLGKIVLGGLSDLRRRNRILAILSGAVVIFYGLFFGSQVFYLAMIGAVAMGFVSSSIFPIMQALVADSCDGRVGTALGLTTSFQSIATVATPIVSASLFALGVGRVIAINAMIPAGLMFIMALLLREPRR